MPPSAASPLPRLPVDLDARGRNALVIIVGLGVAATVVMNEAPLLARQNLGIIGLGLVFLVLMVVAGERIEQLAPAARLGYFALQLSLAAGMFALQAGLGSFGMAWILLLPLLVQGMFVFAAAGLAILGGIVLLLPVLHVFHLAGSRAALEVAFGVGAGIVFVLLFSATTVREGRARRESERLGEELAAANRRLAELAVNAEELATTRERNRVAREIHDSVGHSLTVAHVQLEAAGALLERDPTGSRRALTQAGDAVREGLAELRRSVAALRAGPLENRSLADALGELLQEARAAGLDGELRVAGTARPLAGDVALTLYRVAQEGLTNVRKHAAARRVELRLDYRPRDVALVVLDDGRGAPAAETAEPAEGFGLLGLAERVAILGGALTAGGGAGAGFELRAEIPE